MRLGWLLLLCMLPWSAHAETIYLCTAYSGGMFWSSSPCGPQKAVLDRTVSVPDGLSWDDKVKMGEDVWAQARKLTAPPVQAAPPQQQSAQVNRQAECASLAATISNLDSQARQPQSGYMQDWIRQQRRTASDRRYQLQC
jgi:hypothetical protein